MVWFDVCLNGLNDQARGMLLCITYNNNSENPASAEWKQKLCVHCTHIWFVLRWERVHIARRSFYIYVQIINWNLFRVYGYEFMLWFFWFRTFVNSYGTVRSMRKKVPIKYHSHVWKSGYAPQMWTSVLVEWINYAANTFIFVYILLYNIHKYPRVCARDLLIQFFVFFYLLLLLSSISKRQTCFFSLHFKCEYMSNMQKVVSFSSDIEVRDTRSVINKLLSRTETRAREFWMNQFTFASAIVRTHSVRDHKRRTKIDWESRFSELKTKTLKF